MAKKTNTVRSQERATQSQSQTPDWRALLEEALSKPGRLSEAYSAFHNFSIGNRILAMMQLMRRGLPLSPIASFKAWQAKGRQVRKGEKAISLVMPVTIKREREVHNEAGDVETIVDRKTIFVMRPRWFSYDQTEPMEGRDEAQLPMAATPQWDREKALRTLGITEAPFDCLDGNTQGFAVPSARTIAINPMAVFPLKVTFHELAHCLLHEQEALIEDGLELPRSLAEVEAEAVAYLCCASLGLPGLEESRGYIQAYMMFCRGRADEIQARHAMRIFRATDQILKAGLPGEEDEEEDDDDDAGEEG